MKFSKEKVHWENFIDGDLNAFTSLYVHLKDDLYLYGLKLCQDEFLVKDAIQDVFKGLIEKKDNLDITENVRAYIFKSLRNNVLQELRTRIRRTDIEKKEINAFTENEYENISQKYSFSDEDIKRQKIIQVALSKLSEHQREAIYLKFTYKCSYEQIARIMGIDVPSARTLLFRSIKKLKKIILKHPSK